MRIVIEKAVFEQALTDTLLHQDLLQLVLMCGSERHALLTHPVWSAEVPEVKEWLDREGKSTRQNLEAVLDQGLERARDQSLESTSVKVISERSSSWPTRQLSVPDALRLVGTPLRLLLENSLNDFNFLLALAPAPWRARLLDAKAQGWLEPEHAGGLGELKKRIVERYTCPDTAVANCMRLATWAMFDRDADSSDRSQPSTLSREVSACCEQIAQDWPLGFWQLDRRSIENYLPDEALWDWQSRQSADERNRLGRATRALGSMSRRRPRCRWHYNMKKGLLGDCVGLSKEELSKYKSKDQSPPEAHLDGLFRGLTHEERRDLRDGFGERVAEVYDEAWETIPGWDVAFALGYNDGPKGQRSQQEILQSIFDRL